MSDSFVRRKEDEVHGRPDPYGVLDRLFRPRSVAVVGASPRQENRNRFFVDSLKALGFQGAIYVVNERQEAVDGCAAFKRVSRIPDRVDHVIIAVPAASVRAVLEDCARKKVQFVTVFTSGFGESGDAEGKALEEEIRGWVQTRPLRLIGPNCMGIYCPETGLGFRPDFPSEPGTIGYVSQSGGMTITGVLLGARRALRFSKVVSYGNEVDLSSDEVLHYLARDAQTALVWIYIEGTRRGSELVGAMTAVAKEKPLVVLKGGNTSSGQRAAASHTGSMAGSRSVWRGLLRKVGAVSVDHLEEMVDTTQALLWLPPSKGNRLALICVSGGFSVNYTDLAHQAGFRIPLLSPELTKNLRESIHLPGTSLNNPLDLAAGFFYYPTFPEIFASLDRSGEVDAIVVVLAVEYLSIPEERYPGISERLVRAFLESAKGMMHPFVVVMPPVGEDEKRMRFEREFLEVRIPVFPSMARAVRALSLWSGYWRRRVLYSRSPG